MDGIIIIALKKQSYYCGAFNLALSIKHFNPNINITLVSDGGHQSNYWIEHYSVFDTIKQMDESDYIDNGIFQPGLAKLNINKYTPYDNTLYIDADSLCLQDLAPLFDKLKNNPQNNFFLSHVLGSGLKHQDIHYNPWATNEKIWDYFNLEDQDKLITFNTSWIFFVKESATVFETARDYYNKGFGLLNLKTKWGASYPDELFFTGTCAYLGINPKIDLNVMFFGNEIDSRTLTELQEQYYTFTLYGGGKGKTTVRLQYITWYDKLMFKFCQAKGIEHRFKAPLLMKNKHVNNK